MEWPGQRRNCWGKRRSCTSRAISISRSMRSRLRGLAGEGVDEFALISSARPAWRLTDLEQTQVGGRVGLLRALRPEADEAERGARGRREGARARRREYRQAPGAAVVGEQEPAVGIFAIKGGRLIERARLRTVEEPLRSARRDVAATPMQAGGRSCRPWRRRRRCDRDVEHLGDAAG